MATLTRSKVLKDKNGDPVRVYAVLTTDWTMLTRLSKAINSAGFDTFLRKNPRHSTKKLIAPSVLKRVWIVPNKPLYDVLIRHAYIDKAKGSMKPRDYRKQAIEFFEAIERGEKPKHPTYCKTFAID